MKEFALALSAMTASHHQCPMKPLPELAPLVRSAPPQARYVDVRELRKAIDQYCRQQKRLNRSIGSNGRGVPTVIVSEHVSDEQLAQYSEGLLVEPELGKVEEHLLICEWCCARLTEFDDKWGLNG
jgi:hypothetical protein